MLSQVILPRQLISAAGRTGSGQAGALLPARPGQETPGWNALPGALWAPRGSLGVCMVCRWKERFVCGGKGESGPAPSWLGSWWVCTDPGAALPRPRAAREPAAVRACLVFKGSVICLTCFWLLPFAFGQCVTKREENIGENIPDSSFV